MPWSNLTHHDAAIGTTLSTLPYYLYTPSRALDSVHLVTWLHGGIFSSGPAKQRLDLMAHTFAALDNCYVLHPIAPAGVNWLGYYRNHPGVVRRFDEPVTPLMKQLMQLIEHVRGTALPSARRGLLIVAEHPWAGTPRGISSRATHASSTSRCPCAAVVTLLKPGGLGGR